MPFRFQARIGLAMATNETIMSDSPKRRRQRAAQKEILTFFTQPSERAGGRGCCSRIYSHRATRSGLSLVGRDLVAENQGCQMQYKYIIKDRTLKEVGLDHEENFVQTVHPGALVRATQYTEMLVLLVFVGPTGNALNWDLHEI
jgi:hypothetical protein